MRATFIVLTNAYTDEREIVNLDKILRAWEEIGKLALDFYKETYEQFKHSLMLAFDRK